VSLWILYWIVNYDYEALLADCDDDITFLGKVSDQAYYTLGDPYDIDLDAASPNWSLFTNIM